QPVCLTEPSLVVDVSRSFRGLSAPTAELCRAPMPDRRGLGEVATVFEIFLRLVGEAELPLDATAGEERVLQALATGLLHLDRVGERVAGEVRLALLLVGEAEAVVADAEERLGGDGATEGVDRLVDVAVLVVGPAEVAPALLGAVVEDVVRERLEDADRV